VNPTNIEHVVPVAHSKPVRLDAWRWEGVVDFDEYREQVLAREARRARLAIEAYARKLVEPTSRGFA
jgi:hypothetical protein